MHPNLHQDPPTPLAARPPAHHPYACARCRLRRVKCDKVITGCEKCSEARTQCIYSARRPRKTQAQKAENPLMPAGGSADDATRNPSSKDSVDASDESRVDGDDDDLVVSREMLDTKFEGRFNTKDSDHGRLFVAQGKSRYIDSGKADQVADIEKVLAADSNANEEEANPNSRLPVSLDSYMDSSILLGTSNSKQSLQTYHPSPQHSISLWAYYVRNIDMLVKILHRPTVEALIVSASENLKGIDAATESLLFAIWFASVMTMSTEECWTLHKEERGALLRRYRYGLEKALAQARWMTTQDIVVLQALTLLIVFAQGKNARMNWMLSGMAMNIAQAMGLHRDGTCFSLSAIETEVRRRVWWSLCQLDNRISGDCGLEPHVPVNMDTKLPLHINDSDLDTGCEEHRAFRTEFTEMTVSLIKIEMANTSLKVKRPQCETPPLSKEGIATLLREQIRRYEDSYLRCLNECSQLHRLCHLGTRLIITKLWRMTYEIPKRSEITEYEEIKDRLISYNTDILEITHQLPDKSRQFGWFFGCKYSQWHAMAYILIGLCKHPQGPAVDRAWAVLNAVFSDFSKDRADTIGLTGVQKENTRNVLWRPLLKLLERAQCVRKETLQAHQDMSHSSDAPPTLDARDITSGLNPSERDFQSLYQDDCLSDPFLGFVPDFGEEMKLDEMESWIQSVQSDFIFQQDSMDDQAKQFSTW